ncbi:hypothetical protein [Bradyrhizobium cenepequi]|uniref:hypothetical protein n=1 Tax=Bradyrhizobium cenepequi TaxID=2821403 RepID=UPI001CE38665|nr:hypothetical protein [Bradyrhizobium cenepequi]MCA6106332.1 hypothetical protein [Bradyrhizobium cenepequi]
MRTSFRVSLVPFIMIVVASPADAEQRPLPGQTQMPATLTGKERLGKKWMDEQRIDNCNVPPDKRGAKLRPGACSHGPAS